MLHWHTLRQMALQRALQRALTITYVSSSLYPRGPRDIPELVALCGLYQVGCVLYTECCTKSVVPSLLCQVCRTKCVVPSVLYKCVVPRVLYQECCTKSVVAPSMSCQVCCTKSVGPSVLCQECCTKSVGPSMLRQVCCTKSVVPIVLYQVCYTKCVVPSVLYQVCCTKCQRQSSKWCCRIVCDVCVNSSIKTLQIKLRISAQCISFACVSLFLSRVWKPQNITLDLWDCPRPTPSYVNLNNTPFLSICVALQVMVFGAESLGHPVAAHVHVPDFRSKPNFESWKPE